MKDLTKKQFNSALARMGWRTLGWRKDGSPYWHWATRTTSYGPSPCTRRALVEYLADVAAHRRKVQA